MIGSIATWLFARAPSAPPAPVKRFALPFPEEQKWVPRGVVISADGSRFVHVASTGKVEEPHAEEEDMHFNLPSSLRILQETSAK